jgi:hypothetical protein
MVPSPPERPEPHTARPRADGEPAAQSPWSAWATTLRDSVDQVGAAPDAVTSLRGLAALTHQVERATVDAVAAARQLDPPASWRTIATALGVSRQSAHERFSAVGQSAAAGRRWRRRHTALAAAPPPGGEQGPG